MAAQQQAPGGQAQQGGTEPEEGLPLTQGGIYGAVSFVLGYVVTYAYLFVAANDFITEVDSNFELVGWAFFGAQFVQVESGEAPQTVDFLEFLALTDVLELPAILLTLAIGLLLLVAGYRTAGAVYRPDLSPDQGSVYGAMIVVGYLPLTFFAALLFETSATGVSGRPDVFGAVLLAGIVFPALVGALGGYLAVRRRRSRA